MLQGWSARIASTLLASILASVLVGDSGATIVRRFSSERRAEALQEMTEGCGTVVVATIEDTSCFVADPSRDWDIVTEYTASVRETLKGNPGATVKFRDPVGVITSSTVTRVREGSRRVLDIGGTHLLFLSDCKDGPSWLRDYSTIFGDSVRVRNPLGVYPYSSLRDSVLSCLERVSVRSLLDKCDAVVVGHAGTVFGETCSVVVDSIWWQDDSAPVIRVGDIVRTRALRANPENWTWGPEVLPESEVVLFLTHRTVWFASETKYAVWHLQDGSAFVLSNMSRCGEREWMVMDRRQRRELRAQMP